MNEYGGLPWWASHRVREFNLMQHSDGFDAVHYPDEKNNPICSARHPSYEYVEVVYPVDCQWCLDVLGSPVELANALRRLQARLQLAEASVVALKKSLVARDSQLDWGSRRKWPWKAR